MARWLRMPWVVAPTSDGATPVDTVVARRRTGGPTTVKRAEQIWGFWILYGIEPIFGIEFLLEIQGTQWSRRRAPIVSDTD